MHRSTYQSTKPRFHILQSLSSALVHQASPGCDVVWLHRTFSVCQTAWFSKIYTFTEMYPDDFIVKVWVVKNIHLILFLNHSWVALCCGSLSCWRTFCFLIFSFMTKSWRLCFKISWYLIFGSSFHRAPVPDADIQPQNISEPPPCLTVRMHFSSHIHCELWPNNSTSV